jgi:hypothetical protein
VENAALAQAKKKAEHDQRTIVCVDEAGLSLVPMIVRTSAPRGQTPVLRVTRTRDHLSAMGGITPTGRLFMQLHERASKAEDVVRFLRLLGRTLPGTLRIMWDGSRAAVVTRRERTNLWGRDLAHVRHEVVCAKERLHHRHDMLQHCFTHARAEVSLSPTRSITKRLLMISLTVDSTNADEIVSPLR